MFLSKPQACAPFAVAEKDAYDLPTHRAPAYQSAYAASTKNAVRPGGGGEAVAVEVAARSRYNGPNAYGRQTNHGNAS